jgi:hypothetical protein
MMMWLDRTLELVSVMLLCATEIAIGLMSKVGVSWADLCALCHAPAGEHP